MARYSLINDLYQESRLQLFGSRFVEENVYSQHSNVTDRKVGNPDNPDLLVRMGSPVGEQFKRGQRQKQSMTKASIRYLSPAHNSEGRTLLHHSATSNFWSEINPTLQPQVLFSLVKMNCYRILVYYGLVLW
jgi:hypothetical protein